jgi:branched-chain amino acid transport system substrate-binding protein
MWQRASESGADCVLFAGITQNHAAQVVDDVAAGNSAVTFFGGDGVVESAFARALEPKVAARTFLTLYALPPRASGRAGRDFVARFKKRYGREPGPYAPFGYEAMSLALDAISRAGVKDSSPDARSKVRGALFGTRDRRSVVGTSSIDSHGDTTLNTFGGYKIRDRVIVFDRVLSDS